MILTGKTVLQDSVQEFTEILPWLRLTFFLSLLNQLIFIYAIVT